MRKPDFDFNALVTTDVFNDGWEGFSQNFKSTLCCVMDQNLRGCNESIDSLLCFNFSSGRKMILQHICRSVFSMHYHIESHSFVDILVHFPTGKIQERDIQKD